MIDVVRRECVLSGLSLSGKQEALEKVAETAKRCSILAGVWEETILQGLQQREALGSTGFGRGIAIPRCRLSEVTDFVVGLLSIPAGVEFDSLGKDKVKLIVFIIAPEDGANDHVGVLSEISYTLIISGAVGEMMAAKSSEALVDTFQC